MIENNEITLEKILNEYNKYIMSRLIEKSTISTHYEKW